MACQLTLDFTKRGWDCDSKAGLSGVSAIGAACSQALLLKIGGKFLFVLVAAHSEVEVALKLLDQGSRSRSRSPVDSQPRSKQDYRTPSRSPACLSRPHSPSVRSDRSRSVDSMDR
ncbi:hypothetical protein NC651_012409 [Populus alba x Populus x berolinensis]|nr:hypothetical protein NC651_012409 [Populus alba x Populus x berolinensis]